jgi:hypothetical protein
MVELPYSQALHHEGVYGVLSTFPHVLHLSTDQCKWSGATILLLLFSIQSAYLPNKFPKNKHIEIHIKACIAIPHKGPACPQQFYGTRQHLTSTAM